MFWGKLEDAEMTPENPFEKGLQMMTAQQQLAARSLVNLIEMISTSSHRYAEDTKALTQEALSLMNAAKDTKDMASLSSLHKQWADAVVKYSQDQTRTGIHFLEQCGQQAIDLASGVKNSDKPESKS